MKAAGKPYRIGRKNEEYEKGYEGGGGGVKIGTRKLNSTVFMPATLWSQHKKSGSSERLRGKQEGRWTQNRERTRK